MDFLCDLNGFNWIFIGFESDFMGFILDLIGLGGIPMGLKGIYWDSWDLSWIFMGFN